MRPWGPAAVAVLGLAVGAAAASAQDGSAPAPAVPESHLKLGPYAGFGLPPTEFVVPQLPHFEAHVEVHGRDPNEAMFEWWQHFHFETSIYGRGINIQNPMPGGGYNILPLFDWLKKKAKKDKMKPEDEEGPPPPP